MPKGKGYGVKKAMAPRPPRKPKKGKKMMAGKKTRKC
jgi:hypothetical protein